MGSSSGSYRVLARKYRPVSFGGLFGQESVVRILTGAFRSGRIAHAFLLHGTRGVGKTTTARIIARCLNCEGTDDPAALPCGTCPQCIAIGENRHHDVIEMDAASHTGIDDIREVIDSARHVPTMGRCRVYIIDEVHMLSMAAFNGLLKTLEEPPPHARFIFATTELRKLPATVLSRCQRLDLGRPGEGDIRACLHHVLAREEAACEDGALDLIIHAADGSMRDALSLLDQALALCAGTPVDSATVRGMLGHGDRGAILSLFGSLMRGDVPAALTLFGTMCGEGIDPVVILRDLLEMTHWMSRVRTGAGVAHDTFLSGEEKRQAGEMAGGLSVPVLGRCWQMLLKALGEVAMAPDARMAVEMALIRIAYLADLPTPGEIVARLAPGGEGAEASASPATRPPAPPPATSTAAQPAAQPLPRSLAEVAQLCLDMGDSRLHADLFGGARPVSFETGKIGLCPEPGSPPDLAGRLAGRLREWTGRPWVVSLSAGSDNPTLLEARSRKVRTSPVVREALDMFPGARLVIRAGGGNDASGEDGGASGLQGR